MKPPESPDEGRTPRSLPRIAAQAVLALCLLAAGAAPVAAPASPPAPFAAEFELEGEEPEEGWEFEEECEEGEELYEEEGEEFCAEPDGEAATGEECPLRSARVHAVARRNKLKLTIGYTSRRPVRATIRIRQGGTRLGSFKRRLGRSGVLRFTERLAKKRGRRVVVRIQAPSPGRYCAVDDAVLFR